MAINFSSFQVPSSEGLPATYNLRSHTEGSDTLMISFPGQGYKMDAPLMWYSALTALQTGFDVLSVEYSFHVSGASQRDTTIPEVVNEVANGIRSFLESHDYRRVIFVAKSIGTEISMRIAETGKVKADHFVFLTPLEGTIGFINGTDSMLVIVGDNDPAFPEDSLNKLNDRKRVLLIEGGNHLLEIPGDVSRSLGIMKEVVEELKEFFSSIG